MKGIFTLIVVLFFAHNSMSQAVGDFRSFATGNWNVAGNWERFDGAIWVNPAPNFPTSADGIITIRLGHNMTIPNAANILVDQVEYEFLPFVGGNGQIIVASGGIMDVQNGAGDDVRLFNDFVGFGVLDISGTVILNEGATIVDDDYGSLGIGPANASAATFKVRSGGVYQHNYTITGGTIPAGDWQSGSTCEIIGYTSNTTAPAALASSTFHHFIWNCAAQTLPVNLAGALTNINGNFEVNATNNTGTLFITQSTNTTLNVLGDFLVTGNSRVFLGITAASVTVNVTGDFDIASANTLPNAITGTATGTTTVNVDGDFTKSNTSTMALTASPVGTFNLNLEGDWTHDGGTLSSAGTSNISFEGSTVQNVSEIGTANSNINYTVANLSIVDVGTTFIGSTGASNGSFNLAAGGTLRIGGADGIIDGTTTGAIRIPTSNRTFNNNSIIVYNGSVDQNLGDGYPSSSTVNLEIDNSGAGGVTINNSGTTNLLGTLTLTNGSFNIGNNNTLEVQSDFNVDSGTIGGSSTSNLTFGGTGTLDSLAMTSGSEELNELTVGRSGDLIATSDLTVGDTLDLSFGNLNFGGQTLTLEGTVSGTGGLISNSSSNLVIEGSGAFGTLIFSGGSSELNDLTLNRTGGGTAEINSVVTVNNNLNLTAGALTNTSGLAMASGATVVVSSNGSLAGNAPAASGGPYNVTYLGTVTTGVELPSNATDLNNLTVAATGTVNLNSAVTVNGDVNLNGGTLAADANTITMAGDNWFDNAGAFNPGTATVIFSDTTIIGGSDSSPDFGDIQISASSSVTLPSGDLDVSGDLQINSGAGVTTSGGTVVLNSSVDQNIGAGGASLNNITVNKTGGDVLLDNALSITGVLNIQTATEFESDGDLTLISSSDGTSGNASIARLASGASVTGNVNTQRYMSGEGRLFRYISSPITNAAVSSLQDDFPVTGSFTGASTGPGLLANPSLFFYDESVTDNIDSGYVAYPVASNTESLVAGRGYVAFIREDTNPTVIDLTGPVNQGNISLNPTFTSSGSSADDGWNLIGNPYPSSIDWDNIGGWTKANLGSTIYVADNSSGSLVFQEWNGSVGSLTNGIIASGQAFWTQAVSASPTLDITELAKTTTTGEFFRTTNVVPNALTLLLDDGDQVDDAWIVLDENATSSFDAEFDGRKLRNSIFNLSSFDIDKEKMVINVMPPPEITESVKLDVSDAKPGSYTLTFEDLPSFGTDYQLTLIDHFEDESQELAEANNVYQFDITADSSSFGAERLEIVFTNLNAVITSLDDDIEKYFKVFPNPTDNQLNIRIPADKLKGNQVQVSLVDYNGRQIESTSLDRKGGLWVGQLELAVQPDGLYILNVIDSEKSYHLKIIKK